MTHVLIPSAVAEHPGAHGVAIGTLVATWHGMLPDLAYLLPIVYYALLIVDFLIGKTKGKEHSHDEPEDRPE